MRLIATGSARIEHRDTGEPFEISADEIDWVDSSNTERNMGIEAQHIGEIQHHELGTLTLHLIEYPQGVIAEEPIFDINGHKLLDNFFSILIKTQMKMIQIKTKNTQSSSLNQH